MRQPVNHVAFDALYEKRAYQTRTQNMVEHYYSQGGKRAIVIAPTGSGKTVMGARIVGSRRVLWIAHRRELVEQAAVKLEQMVGVGNVNRVMPNVPSRKRFPAAKMQVGTIQSILKADFIENVEMVVLDECHHYAADEYRLITDVYRDELLLGLTATPERSDGRPLNDIFDPKGLVVAAQYSELIESGHIMRLRVVRPIVNLMSNLAMDPVQAYAMYSGGARTLVFAPWVEHAEQWARDFRKHQVRAGCIECKTPKRFRSRALGLFAKGETNVLTSVNTLNEGLDIPETGCVILGRNYDHSGGLIQSVGRVARPAPGKSVATVIDLTGATIKHEGIINQDLEYNIEGRGITPRGGGGSGGRERRDPELNETMMEVSDPGTMPAEWRPEPLELKVRTKAEIDYEKEQVVFKKHGSRAADFFAKYQERMRRTA